MEFRSGCSEGQGFSLNYNPLYAQGGLLGHPGIDIACGYGSDVHALVPGYVYSLFPINNPASDGYTAVFTICETPLEVFEMCYGHVSEIDVSVGDVVSRDQVIAKEGNHGDVWAGNIRITLSMQTNGDQRGHHVHFQKRPVVKTKYATGKLLQTSQGAYRDPLGYYYRVYAPNNGYAGCVDWTAPLFSRDLFFGRSGYDVYLLQKVLGIDPTGFFGPKTLMLLRDYQKANNIPGTGYCGPMTRALLNGKYSQL